MQAKQSKELIHNFLLTGGCAALSRKSGVIWEDKCHNSKGPLLLSSSLSFMC